MNTPNVTFAGTVTVPSIKLNTARTFTTDLTSTTAGSFDGSANVTVGVTGVLPLSHGGTDNDLRNATKGSIIYMAADGSGMWYSSVGTSGQLLTSGGSGKPTWTTATNSNTASTIVKRDSNGGFSAGTITATLSGNASTATKWATARTITLKQGASGSVSIDGSANKDLNVTGVSESYLTWGGKNINGGVSPVGAALSAEHSANRLAYLNPNALYYEYSDDGGSTWTAMDVSNETKIGFVTTSGTVSVGNASTVTTNHRTRITLTAQDGTNGYVYTRPRKLLLNVSTAGHGLTVKIERKTGASGASWTTVGEYELSGWSGWNDIPLSFATLGGGKNQTTNNWYMRLTFATTSVSSNYTTTKTSIIGMRLFGDTCWTRTSNMGETGHLYSYDTAQNATFPAEVTATSFAGSGASLTALNASNINAGTLAAARLPSSGVTAGTYGLDAAASPTFGQKFLVPKIVVDTTGRITAASEYNITLPSLSLINAASATATANAAATSGNVYLNLVSNSAVLNSHRLLCSGPLNITCDANGNITFANTAYTKTQVDTNISNAINNLVNAAPGALDTLDELAAALGDDANFATTVTNLIGGKQATITGAATTITSSNLTANRALISNGDGKVAVSAVTSTELSYLDGVTSSIQTQLNVKTPYATRNKATAATAGWYRIATTAAGISNCNGLFQIVGAASGNHTTATIMAGTSYGNTGSSNISVLQCAQYGGTALTKVRIVYHTSYSGNYAYLEVYNPNAKAITITVKMIGGNGWALVEPNTAGSVPSGYSNKEATLTSGTIYSEKFSGDGASLTGLNAANITAGTLPITRGGTGKVSWTAGGLIYASAATTLAQVAIGSTGQYLKFDGTKPTWASFGNLTLKTTDTAGITSTIGTYNSSAAATLTITAEKFLPTYTSTHTSSLSANQWTTVTTPKGANNEEMENGTYIIQVSTGPGEFFSGTMSWTKTTTVYSTIQYDEVVMHNAGINKGYTHIGVRVYRDATTPKLQLCAIGDSSVSASASSPITIKMRRMI